MYLAAAMRVAFPLAVLPVMAGRLGAEEFGRLGLVLIWAGLLTVWVEGGYLAAATRHAVNAEAQRRLSLARQVFSGRCVLSVPAALVGIGVGGWIIPMPVSALEHWVTAGLLALLACAQGWPATWYLQARSQLHRWAVVDVSIQGLLLLACLAWAHSVWSYLALQCLANALIAVLGWRWIRRDLRAEPALAGVSLWSLREVRPGLQLGAQMLPATAVGAAYGLALPAVAAHQLGRAELGIYYLVDRMVRTLVSSLEPLVQLVYPRIVERFRTGARHAFAYAASWASGGALVGLLIALAAWWWWPAWAARQGDAVPPEALRNVVSVLGWLIPLGMGWRFIGYWMLGSGRYDRAYRSCIAIGAVVGVSGAWWFGDTAVRLAGVAMAAEVAVVLAAVAGMLLTERRRR